MTITTESLAATEAVGALNATAPRVTLSSMGEAVQYMHFVNAGDAAGVDKDSPLNLMTLCFLVMKNGFVVVGKSAPASPANFDEKKGKTFAYEDAIRQLWPLMGFALRDRLSRG